MNTPPPTRSYFGLATRKWVLWTHILSSSLWLGSAAAMILLIVARNRSLDSSLEVYTFSLCVKLIDDYIIIFTCCSAAFSGMLLSWKTKWGFFQHWWIVVKLVVTVIMLFVGAVYLGPWINRTETVLRANRSRNVPLSETLSGTDYQFLNSVVLTIGTIQWFVLAAVMLLSIFKPWGRLKPRRDKKLSKIQ